MPKLTLLDYERAERLTRVSNRVLSDMVKHWDQKSISDPTDATRISWDQNVVSMLSEVIGILTRQEHIDYRNILQVIATTHELRS